MRAPSRRQWIIGTGGMALAAGLGMRPAWAAKWPDGTIRMVTTGTPGSGLDTNSRALADFLADRLSVPVVVDPKPGGGGVIAMDSAARSAPDGQTVLFGVYSNYAQATALFKRPLIDPVKTLQPVALLGTGVGPLLVRKDFPARNFKEFVAYAKQNRVTFGVPILGSSAHLMMAQFAKDTNAKIELVPYKGAAPMMTDLAAGTIDCSITSLSSGKAFMDQGRVRAILIVTGRRTAQLPGVLTWQEEGFTGPTYDLKEYYLVAVPMGTPAEVTQRLAALVHEATEKNDRVKQLRNILIEEEPPVTGAALEQLVRASVPAWQNSLRTAGIEPS